MNEENRQSDESGNVPFSTEDGPDGGVDLVLKKNGNTLLIQCKQWRAWKVGVKVVRELYGVMAARRAQGAILVTSGIFTQDARTAVSDPGTQIRGRSIEVLIGETARARSKVGRCGFVKGDPAAFVALGLRPISRGKA